MEEELLAYLLATSTVTDQVGTRINWSRRPQQDTTFPACVMQRVAGARQYHMGAADGLVDARVQFDVWGETIAATKVAARAIIAALNGYTGTLLKGCFIETERDSIDETNDGNVRLYRTTFDVAIWHTE